MSEQANGTGTPGNTSAGVQYMPKRRNYFITFWDRVYRHAELPKGAQFLIECDDQTQEGRWHGHAFIYFKNPIAFSTVKKLFGKDSHVEKPVSNSRCIAYVRGEISHSNDPDDTTTKTNIREFGLMPMDNGIRRTVGELKNMDNPDELDGHLYNIWKKVRRDQRAEDALDEVLNKIRKEALQAPDIIYVTGKSGAGKTWYAYKHSCIEYDNKDIGVIKFDQNGFATVIREQAKCFIIEEFRDSCITAQEFLQFTDKYVRTLNTKGGYALLNYEKLYICSIKPIEELYKSAGEVNTQFQRRVKWVHKLTAKEEAEVPLDFDVEKLFEIPCHQ